MKNFEYAGFWQRQAALVLDIAIVGLPVIFFSSMFFVPAIYGTEIFEKYEQKQIEFFIEFFKKAVYLELLLIAAAATVLAVFTCSKWQATPGKKIVGLQVIKSNGNKLKFTEAFLRYASLPVVLLTVRTPERFMIYEKLDSVKNKTAESIEEFAQIISTPISGITELITILICVYWLVRISFARENTALHDLLFDTRVVKLSK